MCVCVCVCACACACVCVVHMVCNILADAQTFANDSDDITSLEGELIDIPGIVRPNCPALRRFRGGGWGLRLPLHRRRAGAGGGEYHLNTSAYTHWPPSPLSPLSQNLPPSPPTHITQLSNTQICFYLLQHNLIAFPNNLLGFLCSGEWSR